MEEIALTFLPFPHVFKGERRNGVHYERSQRCFSCDRQCESSTSDRIELCSYGLNYLRIDETLLIAGVSVKDFATHTQASKKMLRRTGREQHVSVKQLEAVKLASVRSTRKLADDLKARQGKVIDEYRHSGEYKAEVVDLLRPDIEKALSQVHDYRQLITQIVQNVNVAVATDFPDLELEKALPRATHETQAIYWAARLMEKKLEAALYLMYPERITDPVKTSLLRFHGLVHKYAKIYERSYKQKDVAIRYDGSSYGQVLGNPDAIGVIPHSFLDNALKYAPRNSTVTLKFAENASTVIFSCVSYGPRILNSEKKDIFTLFFRGSEATSTAEGTGFGLGLAQFIAGAIGAELSVQQESKPTGPEDSHKTTFTATFHKQN